jgi:hypothetical protein
MSRRISALLVLMKTLQLITTESEDGAQAQGEAGWPVGFIAGG